MNQKQLVENLNKYWKEKKTFQKSVDQRSKDMQINTYDGPPFASGDPHYGHLLVSAMKDAIARFQTMKGYKVVRNRGRDCHGLPVEKYVEKQLGIDGKKDIEKMGIKNFVEACRESVNKTNDEWKIMIDTVGRWADIDHAYFTMDLDFMESVMRVFQSLYNKNLVYKGFKNQRYCPSCATGLANNEVNEGYKDKQDPAVTIKFKLFGNNKDKLEKHELTNDGALKHVWGVIKNDKGEILQFFSHKHDEYIFPGGKVDKGETSAQALEREIFEELGVKVKNSNFLYSTKFICKSGIGFNEYYEIQYDGEIENKEKDKHPQMVWVKIEEQENDLGLGFKIENNIIDDSENIIKNFCDLYVYAKLTKEGLKMESEESNVNLLAWTTTPWTLPSNKFLAVGDDVDYAMVYDKESKEYYILANELVKKYYKKADEYILINVIKGKYLAGLRYEPLFEYINQSSIAQKYKDQFFHVLVGDFVTTTDGTGIVHMAPFGIDDLDLMCKILPKDKANEWLFLPINEYCEFTQEVSDYKGIRVYDANKDIIKNLKDSGKLILQTTCEHSYPHCRRCDTPLVCRPMSSWFIKEQEISSESLDNASKIKFVPESIKSRFLDVLKTAPDWNVSRKRYRGSPLPIWLDETEENRIVIGNLDELYHHTKTGSNNITKNILIRHARTDYNQEGKMDSLGLATLNDEGKKQAEELVTKLKSKLKKDDECVLVLSPLKRTFQTLMPSLEEIYGKDEVKKIEERYDELYKNYEKLRKDGELIDYLRNNIKNTDKVLFEIDKNIYVDRRITDNILPECQSNTVVEGFTRAQPMDQKMSPNGESINDQLNRVAGYIEDVNQRFRGKTIITVSHKDAIILMTKRFKDFDYMTRKSDFGMSQANIRIKYWDNDRNTEVDLHKPYIDSYTFKIDGKVFTRVPDVLDCWFESGSMPYGQVNYLGENIKDDDSLTKVKPRGAFPYPAEYIIEGLDQTRGWFRALHILSNGVMGTNSFNNVVINGLILAEDGKKMSKKLKNFPNPKDLFEKYGPDAYRLYLLGSPSVRAEPVRFSEKGVEQIMKDFGSALENSYKFFETYAKVDNFKFNNPDVYFIRHAKAESIEKDAQLTQSGKQSLEEKAFVEKILRVNPEIIYSSSMKRAQDTASAIANIMKRYSNIDVEIRTQEALGFDEKVVACYEEIMADNKEKRILIVGHNYTLGNIRQEYYMQGQAGEKGMGENLEIVKLPSYKITNELDKRIIAELNNLIPTLEDAMNRYELDIATKTVLGFVEKLTNRYIRRSRRRFWASGMDTDKASAFNTLFEVLDVYLRLAAPFAPFTTEYLWLELQKFNGKDKESIHLEMFPMASRFYVDKDFLEEVNVVRRIISLGLFIRSKNSIKTKQPLQSMKIHIE